MSDWIEERFKKRYYYCISCMNTWGKRHNYPYRHRHMVAFPEEFGECISCLKETGTQVIGLKTKKTNQHSLEELE